MAIISSIAFVYTSAVIVEVSLFDRTKRDLKAPVATDDEENCWPVASLIERGDEILLVGIALCLDRVLSLDGFGSLARIVPRLLLLLAAGNGAVDGRFLDVHQSDILSLVLSVTVLPTQRC